MSNAFEQEERSTTRQFGGLGLGLAISKALVEMHGGTIEAHSEGRDKGATFRIQLPLTAPVAQREVAPPAQRAVRPLRILLVEDHGVTAKMMRMVMTTEGHTVETAGDVATALELAERNEFDLLLSDLGLPDGSGHDLMRQLRARGHKFPGIALSGYGLEDDVRRSYQAGFATHLTKPASREAVVGAVASVSAGELTAAGSHAATTSQPRAPSFDADAALGHCLGDHDLFAQMIRIFFDDVEKLLPQIHSELNLSDFVQVGDLGHRMKGTISYLGAEPAKEAAARVERVVQCGVQAEAEEAVRALERECQLLRAALADYHADTAPTQQD